MKKQISPPVTFIDLPSFLTMVAIYRSQEERGYRLCLDIWDPSVDLTLAGRDLLKDICQEAFSPPSVYRHRPIVFQQVHYPFYFRSLEERESSAQKLVALFQAPERYFFKRF
jgi:hypothetical protein